ncbi:translation initiation factor [Planctomyces sp. SH-PL62]|uniref:translation initiation factor n=1 Tax=Planctomyces sp. SH-PL62 TaxID=1636152 RepID=UPI00078DED0D|nr:translation initiation factor [Planctomyces sp. SH-PL62]AMV38663.1 translation initiation factor Sui1 [Planctomyces sp. SH-PL62]
MTRLFAGTPWDRPPVCEACGRLESECACPPKSAEPVRVPPETQTARLALEKRPKGKLVTVVSGLAPEGNDMDDLATRLKSACGTGGTLKDGLIELQGDRREAAEKALQKIGYKTKRR